MKEDIKIKALCLFKRKNQLLLAKYFDKGKNQHFFRPIGGTIEFGEYSRATVEREIWEETGAKIKNLQFLTVLENHFQYELQLHHEIVFVYAASFSDQKLYKEEVIDCIEANGKPFQAHWKSLKEIKNENCFLVPAGIEEWFDHL